mgnify:CR=1 FL=1
MIIDGYVMEIQKHKIKSQTEFADSKFITGRKQKNP